MEFRIRLGDKAAEITKAYLDTQGIKLSDAQALDLVARLHGYSDNESMQDDLTLRADSASEFTLAPNEGAYITVDNILVEIGRDDTGVQLHVYPAPDIGLDVLGSLHVPFSASAAAWKEHEESGGFADTNPFKDP